MWLIEQRKKWYVWQEISESRLLQIKMKAHRAGSELAPAIESGMQIRHSSRCRTKKNKIKGCLLLPAEVMMR